MELILNRTLFHELFTNMVNRVTYCFGGKAADLSMDSSQIHCLDCSGFTQYLLHRCVPNMPTDFPEGSVEQHAWCAANLHLFPYSETAGDDTNQIFVFFLAPEDSPDGIGHTGFFQNGMSFECYGNHGVGSRTAQHLINIGVRYTYCFPSAV